TGPIMRLIDEAAARSSVREPNPGALMLNTVLELRAHPPLFRRAGHREFTDLLLERAIDWYRSRPVEQRSVREGFELVRALFEAGKSSEALELIDLLPDPSTSASPGPSPFAARASPNF